MEGKRKYKNNSSLSVVLRIVNFMNAFTKTISNPKFIFILFFGLVVFATLQAILLTKEHPAPGEWPFTLYNNYVIFKQSFFHLIHKQDLYCLYPNEYYDPYKYSPAFALAFGLLSYLPDMVGLLLWNLLNAFVLFVAIYKLPGIAVKYKSLMLLTAGVELMTCMQSCQSNALIVGLLILAFCMLEKENYLLATLFISLTVFIKLFGIVICILFIFYPKKGKVALYMLGWFALLAIIPIVATDYDQLLFLYNSWLTPLGNDHALSNGYSVIGWLHTWFKLNVNKTLVLLIGVVLLLFPLIKTSKYKDYSFRLMMLSSVLVWMVIFNHMAESPTFIVAMTGVVIWFYAQKPTTINIVLLILCIVFTCLSPTDIFPPYIRQHFFQPYVIKAVPCILIWIKMIYDLMADKLSLRVSNT